LSEKNIDRFIIILKRASECVRLTTEDILEVYSLPRARWILPACFLQTGAHSALIVIPDSLKVHKLATAGDFNSFLHVYATAITEQKKAKRYDVKFRIDDLWETIQDQGGLHRIEARCDGATVHNFKGAYLASLVRNPGRRSFTEIESRDYGIHTPEKLREKFFGKDPAATMRLLLPLILYTTALGLCCFNSNLCER
jgi:hypothetical protein